MEKPKLQNGKIVRSEEPLNLEMPFEQLDRFIPATKWFYVRSHFPIPKIDRSKWRLQVEGEVEKPFAIGYDELLSLDSRKLPVTLECTVTPAVPAAVAPGITMLICAGDT